MQPMYLHVKLIWFNLLFFSFCSLVAFVKMIAAISFPQSFSFNALLSTGVAVYVGTEPRSEPAAVSCSAQLCGNIPSYPAHSPGSHVCCEAQGSDSCREEQVEATVLQHIHQGKYSITFLITLLLYVC